MRRLIAMAAVILVAALVVGCGITSPVTITARPEVRELVRAGLPKFEYTIVVSPVVMKQVFKPKKQGATTVSVIPDTAAIQDVVVTVLRDLELFRDVDRVEGAPEDEPAAIEMASAAKPDFVLVPKVTQFDVSYVGRNGNYIPKLVLWSLLEWASWFVADEPYRVDMTCEFSFRDGENGNMLYHQTVSVSTEKPVTDFQRGIKIWGIVRIPGSLNDKNYKNVGFVVGPHAVQEVGLGFLQNVIPAYYRFTKTDRFAKRFSRSPDKKPIRPVKPPERDLPPPEVVEAVRSIAYIFGVDSYDELSFDPLNHAAADAAAFKELLTKSLKPEFKSDDVHILLNEWASRSAVKGALDDLIASSKEKLDTVVFYFAGRGAITENEGDQASFYILPQDAEAVNVEGSGLSLEDLASSLRLVNAEHVIVILDCGFEPFGAGRSVPTGARFAGALNFPSSIYRKEGYALLTASSPGKSAFESGELRHGIFTNALIKAGSEVRKYNRDFDLRRAFKYLASAVSDGAKRAGTKQQPQLLGSEGVKVILLGEKNDKKEPKKEQVKPKEVRPEPEVPPKPEDKPEDKPGQSGEDKGGAENGTGQ